MKKYLMIMCISLLFASISYGQHPEYKENQKCADCHKDCQIENIVMTDKKKEKAFVDKAFMQFDGTFGEKHCYNSCHISTCVDCHKGTGKNISKPKTDDCLVCHKDTYTGIEYMGLGIREDHERYKRGIEKDGEYYLKMLPSVHYEKGMQCSDCHTKNNILGKEKAKDCLECHTYNKDIIDHSIKGHDKVACISCHASYSPMELGTFYLRFRESTYSEYVKELPQISDEYFKSSFMRVNERPPLVIDNETGKYVPAKPSKIIFTTNTYKDLVVGQENKMTANRWKVTYPHTVRRETVLCSSCHDNERAFLLESDENRILYPDKDGLAVKSFYNSEKFSIENARFVTIKEYEKINSKSKEYLQKYFEKLDQLKEVINKSVPEKK
ncbi:MAG: selenite/tellurite reduction operon b-type cytochrome iron-sulfur cluster-binding subunit ExtO [Candidatus Mucispirillum faecigallinarum]|nr:selenite/tellurite reduction operon b-type cytochrome iron-sulfur cluster-binding subunit ExtO [Candidatus Mucispirillum faecigallinarum]